MRPSMPFARHAPPDDATSISPNQLLLVAGVFHTLAFNQSFLAAAIKGRDIVSAGTWTFGAALLLAVAAINLVLAGLLSHPRTLKPWLALLTVVAAVASHFINAFSVMLEPSMLRNVLHTDPAEAVELLTWPFMLHMLLYAGLPLALLWRVKLAVRPWRAELAARLALLGAALLTIVLTLWLVFQPLASLMRNDRTVRYLITPANVLWSGARVLAADARGAARPRLPIGTDTQAGASWATRQRPMVLILAIGETARAANWGLNGYARQTTPQLAQVSELVNFKHVSSCGTDTETSLPCMFAPAGRRDYDEARIRAQQSLLHVLARAGAVVHWRDNQSGCKGVCEGLPQESVSAAGAPGLCDGARCFDEGLVHDLDKRLANARGTQVWVLHMLGSHGPAYFRRYPRAFARFLPECRSDDLQACSQQELLNAYDNSLLYTDHVLATAIATLRARQADVDSALLYVSDHGESLGERGLYLHGMPWAIAPKEQTQVPMVWWASAGFERGAGLRPGCLQAQLRERAAAPLSHDHLFHTLLGALNVRTALHQSALDLTDGCRPPAP